MASKPPSRRVHARFSCDLPVEIYSGASAAKLADARLLDLSLGGGAISTPLSLQRGGVYEFRFNWGKERLTVMGRVMWAQAGKFGVSFDLTPAQEHLLRALVDKLRGQALP
jgi:hypothetical protein